MNIEKYSETIGYCRYCFMCRHLSGIGNVTFTEADTPRIRAAMLYSVLQDPEKLRNPDLIATLYRSDLSRACTWHCVSHFEENSLNIAARTDIVEAGLAPKKIKALAAELEQSAKWTVKGQGKVVFFEDNYTAEASSVSAAFAQLMKSAGIAYQTVSGGCIGKALKVLGLRPEAEKVAKKFVQFINDLQADVVVVTNPAAYDALVNDCPAYGCTVNAKVMHSSEFLVEHPLAYQKKPGQVYYLESDYLRNYNNDYPFPRRLLALLGAEVCPFGTNNEESYTCGEGAVVLPKIAEELIPKLAQYIEERADHPATDVFVVASPYTKLQLSKYTSLTVKTLEELAAENL